MSGVLIDANLLCLLVVGSADPSAIAKHARLRTFDWGDYQNLISIFDRVGDPILCAPVLAETSNLVAYRQTPYLSERFRSSLGGIVSRCEEHSSAALRGIADISFNRLGFTDAILLVLASSYRTGLLSDDLALCLEAERRGFRSINYSYIRDGALRIDQL